MNRPICYMINVMVAALSIIRKVMLSMKNFAWGIIVQSPERTFV
jgi:hypothetical protein